jgi:hypothetical protein
MATFAAISQLRNALKNVKFNNIFKGKEDEGNQK